MALAAVFLVFLLSAPTVFGAQYSVKWALGQDYSSWTDKALNEGDTLVFSYDGTHTVDTVSKTDYENCDSSNSIQSSTTSPTTITLKSGTTYFVCGTAGHCTGGMKLQVTAKAASGGGNSTPATPSATPTPSGSGSSPSSGSTPSTPSGNGAAASLSGVNLMVGATLAMGALVAFMV